jgi:UDP-glucose 4-epimerase
MVGKFMAPPYGPKGKELDAHPRRRESKASVLRRREIPVTVARITVDDAFGYHRAEVVQTTEKVTGFPVRAETCPRRPGDPPTLVSDSGRARELLGWTPKYPNLDQQIAHAWIWFHDKMPDV